MIGKIVKGAVAGAAATWVMSAVSQFLYEREDPEAVEAEREARGGESAYATAAGRAGQLVGLRPDPEQRRNAGAALHWGLGVGGGVAYALFRPLLPGVGAGRGLSFGGAFFALVDEYALPALDVAPGFAAFPWETHARGLASHLAYGVTAEAVLQALGDPGRRRAREPDLLIQA